MPVQDLQPPAHELVVVRLVARRAAQLGDAGLLGDRDPDLGREHALHVQAGDHGRGVYPSPGLSHKAARNPYPAESRLR